LDLIPVLEKLSEVGGPSGFERPVVEVAAALLRPYMEETYIDRFGNLVGIRRCGKPGAKALLLDAHLDEVGLIVTGVEKGFLRFRSIGGVDPRILPDRRVQILTKPIIQGVIACLPPHLQKESDQNTATPIEELWIDAGLSQEEAHKRIPVGTPVVYGAAFTSLQNGHVAGKAMDDRACFTTLLFVAEALQDKDLDVDLYIMGSTREEVNGSGAAVGTFALKPDCAIAVDVTHGRTPDGSKDETFLLGKGPVIGIGPNMTRWMADRLVKKAEELGYAWQPEVMTGHSGTNAWRMQIARDGVATAVLSIPLKYMHTPFEVIQIADIEATGKLLAAFVEGFSGEGRCMA